MVGLDHAQPEVLELFIEGVQSVKDIIMPDPDSDELMSKLSKNYDYFGS